MNYNMNYNTNFSTSGFGPLEAYVHHQFTKVASREDTLFGDTYCAGFEAGMGVPGAVDTATKIASRNVGREIMNEFIPMFFLDK